MIFFSILLFLHNCLCTFTADSFKLSAPYLRGIEDGLSDWTPAQSVVVLENVIQLTQNSHKSTGSLWTNSANLLEEWEANFEINVFLVFLPDVNIIYFIDSRR